MELDKLIEKTYEALRRDVNHILAASAGSKLDAASARDLVNYYKLLSDIKRQQEKDDSGLAKLSDEELEKRIKALLERSSAGAPEEAESKQV